MPTLESSINITAIQAGELAVKPSTPFSTGWKLYFKSDGLYQVDDADVETALSGTSGPAPNDAQYVVTALVAGLSAEVLLSAELSSPTAIGDVAASTGKFTTAESTAGADFNTGQSGNFNVSTAAETDLFRVESATNRINIGGTIGAPGFFNINGRTNQRQLVIEGNATQTLALLQMNDSSGNVVHEFHVDGEIIFGQNQAFAGNVTWMTQNDADNFTINSGSGKVGIGVDHLASEARLHVVGREDVPVLMVDANATQTSNLAEFRNTSEVDQILFTGTGGATFNDELNDANFIVKGDTDADLLFVDAGADRVGIGVGAPLGKLHVDQASGTGAVPVLYLDQADDSEEMIEFAGTIGTGNAIEAEGGKSLTKTHFIKITLPGALTRYIEVGTIA